MSFYFASNTNKSCPDSKEIDLLSPRQEKKLAKASWNRSTSLQPEPAVVENFPKGSKPQEFYSRPVSRPRNDSIFSAEEQYESHQKEMIAPPSPGYMDPPIGSLLLDRKVPVKIDPKVFFAVERTFLLWMHSALWLLAAAMSILAFGYEDPQKLIYAATMLPVAVTFMGYALFQCKYAFLSLIPRVSYFNIIIIVLQWYTKIHDIQCKCADIRRVGLLRVKAPGPYVDIVGPTILTIVLMVAIVTQFGLKLYHISMR